MIPPGEAMGQELERDGITSSVNVMEAVRRRPWILLEFLLAGALIAWRFVAPTWHPVWQDLLFYLGLYWIYTAAAPESKAWTGVTLAIMIGFLAICLRAQLPHILVAFELLP